MYNYETASQAITDLAKRGYDMDFNISQDKECIVGDQIIGKKEALVLSPEDFEIDEIYRFEGNSDPGDETVVYAISSKKHDVKGVLVNAYGPYSDTIASDVIRKLSAHLHFGAYNLN
ncbi:MAG TPA: phosphoribosylpyrophosphate synthetase [Bacteroidia bacterium]|jgi:hypothetical protein|nr:phosphoribosylpyrophosphate synthetase [Bacteroidia bacterium]